MRSPLAAAQPASPQIGLSGPAAPPQYSPEARLAVFAPALWKTPPCFPHRDSRRGANVCHGVTAGGAVPHHGPKQAGQHFQLAADRQGGCIFVLAYHLLPLNYCVMVDLGHLIGCRDAEPAHGMRHFLAVSATGAGTLLTG